MREVGRRIMAWVLNHVEPEHTQRHRLACAFEGRLYRRRGKQRARVATLFGPVEVWRRLYEPLERGVRCFHPLALRLGLKPVWPLQRSPSASGSGPPITRNGKCWRCWRDDHGVHWSCTSLRKVLASLSAGMAHAPPRTSQVEQVVRWLAQARASTGRYRPTLAVGRDGIFVPLRHKVWQEGATATVSVLDRRGKRLGTVYLGHMPESGQATLTAQ